MTDNLARDETQPTRRGGITLLLTQAFLVATAVVLAGGVTTYFENLENYSFSLYQLAPWLFFLWLLAGFLLFALAWGISRWVPSATYWLLPAIVVVLWGQNAFNIPDYGALDGSAVDWPRVRYLYDLAFVALVAGGVWALRKHLRSLALTVPVVVFAIYLVYAITAVLATDEDMPVASVSEADIHRLSESRNVFFVILDEFQADILQELIDDDPAWRDKLDGFTFWPNAVAYYPSTVPAITAMLVAEPWLNDPEFWDFRDRAYSEDSLLHDFRLADYQVDLLKRGGWPPPGRGRDYHDNTITNLRTGFTWRTVLEEAVGVVEFTLFRHSPQLMRRGLYRNGTWTLSRQVFRDHPDSPPHRQDLSMLQEFQREARVEGEQPVFRFIHFFTPHLPIVFDDQLRPRRGGRTRDNYRDQAESGLRLLLGIIETLKQQGVYENSRFLVIADHGSRGFTLNERRYDFAGDEKPLDGRRGKGRVIAGGVPLLLTRDFDETGPMRTDQAPVSMEDVARTLVDGIGDHQRFQGYSLFSERPPEDRLRHHYHYIWGDHGWSAQFYDPITVYEIDGHSWSPASWSDPLEQIGEGGERRPLGPDDIQDGVPVNR